MMYKSLLANSGHFWKVVLEYRINKLKRQPLKTENSYKSKAFDERGKAEHKWIGIRTFPLQAEKFPMPHYPLFKITITPLVTPGGLLGYISSLGTTYSRKGSPPYYHRPAEA